MHVDAAGPATRLPLPRIDSRAVTILVRLPRRPSSRSPAALSRTSFVAQARSGASGNRQTLARSAVTDSSGQTIDPPDREPAQHAWLVAGGGRIAGATNQSGRASCLERARRDM